MTFKPLAMAGRPGLSDECRGCFFSGRRVLNAKEVQASRSRGMRQCAWRKEVHAGAKAPVRCFPVKCEARNLALLRLERSRAKK